MCLGEFAHGLRESHPIFQGPLPVELEFEDVAVPENYHQWPGGDELGATMPMWRVQSVGRAEDLPPGIVSDPTGFLDSPDAEIVSGGLNMKGSRSVAIGRQGNLVLWGFHASPSQLTASGRAAFVNTVAWASGFDHTPRLVQKVSASREEADVLLALGAALLPTMYTDEVAWIEVRRQQRAALERAAKERELTDDERAHLEEELPTPTTREDFDAQTLKRWFGERLFATCGMDIAAYRTWFDSNREYLLCAPGERYFTLDEDALALGLSNREVDSLFDAAHELESADASRAKHAAAFLRRATAQEFETAAEWTAWLELTEERLFHSDVGGYRFFETPAPPGPLEPAEPGALKVAFAASLCQDESGPFVVVRARVAQGWHLYGRVAPASPYQAVALTEQLGAGLAAAGDWRRPTGRPHSGAPGSTTLAGSLVFRLPVALATDVDPRHLGAVVVTYQVCDERMCLQPTEVRVPVVDRRGR